MMYLDLIFLVKEKRAKNTIIEKKSCYRAFNKLLKRKDMAGGEGDKIPL